MQYQKSRHLHAIIPLPQGKNREREREERREEGKSATCGLRLCLSECGAAPTRSPPQHETTREGKRDSRLAPGRLLPARRAVVASGSRSRSPTCSSHDVTA
ncbi:unnamed protein product [Caenorhabditis auriculariae]|uniref:Uncharacterized protein n=1 Tax=Caenorhabditis auriculariae TaxID=2777116 RepID=A0A8S1HNQ9_9PELO|nr:unnamed protein product [Caenorhabditis auriculariae]